jgi:hypothetical protein
MDAKRHADETQSPLGDEVVRQAPERSVGAAQPLDGGSAAWPHAKGDLMKPCMGYRVPMARERDAFGGFMSRCRHCERSEAT